VTNKTIVTLQNEITKLRTELRIARGEMIEGDYVTLIEQRDEIKRLRALLEPCRCNSDPHAKCEKLEQENEQLKLEIVTCRRLLREAVLRDGLVDERWFVEAVKAGGDDE
jgi:hypothetical protein